MRTILAATLAAVTIVASQAAADPLNLKSSAWRDKTRVLDERASREVSRRVSLDSSLDIPGRPGSFDGPVFVGRYAGPYLGMARDAARRNGVPEDLFLRLVQQESGWNPGAVSHKGAMGLAQLMPSTARKLRVDPRDPAQNLDGGARYLRMQYDRFRDWRLALAAYNAGPGAVEKYGGVPPYRETQGYVRAILGS